MSKHLNGLSKLMIEITSKCNYTCEGCPTLDLPRGNKHMDANLFKRIFDEVGNTVDKVMLWNYGESLSHPEIEDMLTYTKNFSSFKVLSTNGSYFNKFKNFEFLKSLDVLVVSINGLDQETYSFHQRGGNLNNVLTGANKVCDYLKDSNTITVFQTVVNKQNINQIQDINDFARKLGFKEVTLKSFNVMDGKDRTFDKFVPINEEFSRYSGNKDKRISSEKSTYCQEGLVINWNGDVNLCCWDYKGIQILGNIYNNSLNEIWNNSTQLRSDINNGLALGVCNNCEVSRSIAKWTIK